MNDDSKKRTIFLSSVFVDEFEGVKKYVPLRERIIENKRMLPVWLWAYEHYWPKDSEKTDPDADTIIDRCFSGIKSCDLFVFLLTHRHGSGATYFPDPAFASYLEMELFAAALLKKPILVLHERGHEPDRDLKDTMVLLNRHFASGAYVVDTEDGLYRAFRDACAALAEDNFNLDEVSAEAKLPEWISVQRSKTDLQLDLSDPSLFFLNDSLRAAKRIGDTDLADRLLGQVASGVRRSADGSDKLMPQGASLFRIWAAMRELMGDMDAMQSDANVAKLWDRALGLWAGKASWFGVHGHIWMGPLAAINTQIKLRKAYSSNPEFKQAENLREPVGARASALYSVAQKMATRKRKLWHFRQAAVLATEAIEKDKGAHQGALAIRGHVALQMAKLGQLWKLWEATEDFKESLRLREMSHASAASIGEAMCDLGFVYVLTRRRNKGFGLLQEGIARLRQNPSVDGKAFLARGLRTMERAAQIAGSRDLELKAHEERLELAKETEALDQARDV